MIGRYLLPLLVFVLAGCPSAGQDVGSSAAIESVAPHFSGDSAYQHIRTQVAFGPRVPNTAGHRAQLAWMLEYLRERADTVTDQVWTHTTTMGTPLMLTNVLARFNPAAQDRILLIAHWDTRPTADQDPDELKRGEPISGANDGASGTALLLEIANVLSKNPPPIGVDLLFVDGEDFAPNNMYLGARYFAANLPPGYRPLYGILVDMIADEQPSYPLELNSQEQAPEIVDRVWRTAEQLGHGRYFTRTSQGAIEDDHMPLNRAGIRTINIIDFDYGPANSYWHTTADVLEHTSPRGLEVVGSVLLELIFRGG
ncbi:MAG: M28 family peptidase [Gemmatimonadota bacterium]